MFHIPNRPAKSSQRTAAEIELNNGSMFFIPGENASSDDETSPQEDIIQETLQDKKTVETEAKIELKVREAAVKRNSYRKKPNVSVHPSWMSRIAQQVRESEYSKM